MSLTLLHFPVMGFVLVLVVLVLDPYPRSVGVVEYRSVAFFPDWIRLETLSTGTQ